MYRSNDESLGLGEDFKFGIEFEVFNVNTSSNIRNISRNFVEKIKGKLGKLYRKRRKCGCIFAFLCYSNSYWIGKRGYHGYTDKITHACPAQAPAVAQDADQTPGGQRGELGDFCPDAPALLHVGGAAQL